MVHELAINAIEHGAMVGQHGRVAVSWTITPRAPHAEFSLQWKETGMTGLTEPSRRGFGSEVLSKMISHELGAITTLNFEPDGLHYGMRFPLSPRIGNAASDEEADKLP